MGVTVTGNIGTVFFLFIYLILRVHGPVDFSKSVLNRHPGEDQATRDAAVRDGAVSQEDMVNKRSKLVRLSSSAHLGLRRGVLGQALPAGKVMGSLPGPLRPGKPRGETISRD